MKVHPRRKRAGFSLAELLVVIGIIGVLLGIAVPAVLYYQRELKFTELDDSARAVFIATQNNLTALRSANAGELEVGTGIGRGVKDAPGAVNTLAETELKYVSTDVNDAKPGWLVLPGSIEGDLAEGHYLVEFDPKSGSVYGVFFTQDTELNESAYQKLYQHADNIRARAGRKSFASASGGFFVGYYGADGALDMDRPDAKTLPKPKLKLTNAEELVLEIDMDAVTGIDPSKVFASVSVSDGTASRVLVDKGAVLSGTTNKVVLDTLKSYASPSLNAAGWTAGNSFAGWMASGGSYVIAPGKDITVTVSVFYDDAGAGIVALPQSASVNTNSLFAARSGDTAQVAYGRHLQNLHPGISHLDSTVTKAQQVRAIDFAKAGADHYAWETTYGRAGKPFEPIVNDNLKSYDGSGMTIASLNVNTSGNAGLFGTFKGNRLENVTLVDAVVTGGSNVGALAGRAENATVSNCRAYMTGNKVGADTQLPKLKGTSHVGGLVGSASTVTVENGSFASVMIDKGVTVGGLVGRTEGAVTVKESYAAGWLRGTLMGGLVGRADGGLTIEDCYAAGTVAQAWTQNGNSPKVGGLTSSNATVWRSYAAVEYDETKIESGAEVYGAVPGGGGSNVYYLVQSGVNDKAATLGVAVSASDKMKKGQDLSALGAAFIEGDDSSVTAKPYNLNMLEGERDPRLEAPYPYPTLKVIQGSQELKLPHYGDWLVAEGSTVTSLVAYYEQFLSGAGYVTEYSAHVNGTEKGAIKDATRTGAINADGYAFLSVEKLHYDWESAANLTVKTVGMETLESTVSARYMGVLDEDLQPTTEDAAAYYVYTIPTTALDVVPGSACYNEVTVKGTGPQIQWDIPPKEVETTAWVTTFFGRAAYNGAKPTSVPNPIHIRSLRHLANVGRFFGARNYVQDLDIDAQIYIGDLAVDRNGNSLTYEMIKTNDAGHLTVAGFEMWGKNWDNTWGYQSNPWSLPAEYRLRVTPMGMHGTPGDAANGYEKITSFNGVYDGNGRTIRALSIRSYDDQEDKQAKYAGLFYRVTSGTLKNIHLSDCDVVGDVNSSTDANSTGVLLGRLNSTGQVLDCTVKDCTVAIQATSKKPGGHVGGLIGRADGGAFTIRGCTVESTSVTGDNKTYNAGGLVGYVYDLRSGGTVQDCTVKNVQVSNQLSNTGAASVEKYGTIAGFVGCMKNNGGAVDNCFVIGTKDQSVSGASLYSGGFVGLMSNKDTGAIKNCGVRLEDRAQRDYAAQSVRGGSVSGGFVGILKAGVIQSSYAAVKVEGATAGGFVGTLEGGSISNCYAGGHTQSGKYKPSRPNVVGTEKAGGFAGLWENGTVSACYTTCAASGVSADDTDVFAPLNSGAAAKSAPGCYALGVTYVNDTKQDGLNKSNVPGTEKLTKLDVGARTETHPYDAALTMKYPFTATKYADGTMMPHYGDWPEELSTGGSGRKWVQQVQEYTEIEKDYDNLTVDPPVWNGDTLTITYHVDSLYYGNDLPNTGPKLPDGTPYFNGVFSLTSDLGYRQIFRFVSGADGYQIQGLPGATFTRTEVGTPGQPGHGFTWVINVPSELIPPYVDHVSLDAMEHIDGEGDKCIIKNIINADPNYSGANKVTKLGDDEGITIGEGTPNTTECFNDWLGDRHQLMEIMAPLADTPLNGHMEGAALGLDNAVYFHMVNGDKNDFWATNLGNSAILNIAEITLEGPNGLKVILPRSDLLNGNFPYPSEKPGTVRYKLWANLYLAEKGTYVKLECVDLVFYASADREEFEMGVDLDLIAETIGYESGDVFTRAVLKFNSDTMRDLVVERDPPET